MSRTAKDEALDRGEPPTCVYVGFAPDPLNTRVVYWEPHAFMYSQDAHADFDGEVYEYQLVRKRTRE
jgi:hypothetical protein